MAALATNAYGIGMKNFTDLHIQKPVPSPWIGASQRAYFAQKSLNFAQCTGLPQALSPPPENRAGTQRTSQVP
jgi:hypothetical protein